jgi:hypothetical protein
MKYYFGDEIWRRQEKIAAGKQLMLLLVLTDKVGLNVG